MSVLESIARGYENIRQFREDHPLFRVGTNSAGIYGALSLGGNLLSALTGTQELNNIADMAAPVVAGGYAWAGVNNVMPHSNLGDFIKVLIAAGIGYDLAGEITSIPPHSNLSFLNGIYSGIYSTASHVANSMGMGFPNVKVVSAAAGGLTAMLSILSSYSKRIRAEKAVARPLF